MLHLTGKIFDIDINETVLTIKKMICEICYNIFPIRNTIYCLFTGILKSIFKHHDLTDKETLIKLILILFNNYFSMQLKLKKNFFFQNEVYPMGDADPNVRNYERPPTFFPKTAPLLYHDNFCNDLNMIIITS